jgi:hypothetical protein
MEQIDFRPVLLAWASLQADEMGAKKCSRKGVGGLLRHLRAHDDATLPQVYGASAGRAVRLLENHCRHCGKCPRDRIAPDVPKDDRA